MKRFISSFISLLMVTSVIAGCGTKNTTQTSQAANPAETKTSTDTTKSESTGEAKTNREVITIDINTGDEGVTFDPANDEMAKMILDRFGIQFSPRNISDTTEYVLLAASNNLPDVFYNEPLYYIDNYINFIEDGYFKEIPQEMIDKYPLINEIINTSDLCVATKEMYGGNYALPKPDSMDRSLYIAERRGIYYRKDWAEKFGITSAPTNAEDLYTMLKHFTFDDPDGNGANDTWGISASKGGELRTWFAAWGINNKNWVKDTDGTWTHGQLLEANIEPLKYFRKLYEEGILDPEFAQVDYKQVQQKLAGGTVGAITRNADTAWINTVIVEQFGAANPGVDPFEKVGLIPILAKDANSEPHAEKYLLDMCATQFNADISDEALDRYLEFHEWAMTQEGVNHKLGFEGKDWQINAEGNYEYIPTADGKNPVIANLYPSIALLNMPSWGFELDCDYKWPKEIFGQYANQVRDLSAEARALRNPHALSNNIQVKLISAPSKLEADGFKFDEAVSEIVMGTEPVEKMFADMVQKAMDSGFTKAIEEVNAYVKENNIN